ncbi:MAG: YvcK family protein [Parcubacteria group bacterium]|nr:YvcK family protein [Parcubacteria group bacterium]
MQTTPEQPEIGRRPLVVTIGGGTGQYTILTGLKEYPIDIAAIVSMADDSGSTGALRDELGVLPPGDVRQCLAALSKETPTMRALFSYRFSAGSVKGHAFGNLFLSALEKITGSFAAAVAEACRILAVSGEVIPVTEGNMRLLIELKDGTQVSGEHFLDGDERVRTVGVKRVALQTPVVGHSRAVECIKHADLIVIGPGDLYGSVLPPLLVPEIAQAVRDTAAPLMYVANLTNKKGQTDGFTAHDYAHVIHEYLGTHCIDVLLCNTTPPAPHLLERYIEQEGKGMIVECVEGTDEPYRVIARDFISTDSQMIHPHDELGHTRSYIRHDPIKLAAAVIEVLSQTARV